VWLIAEVLTRSRIVGRQGADGEAAIKERVKALTDPLPDYQ